MAPTNADISTGSPPPTNDSGGVTLEEQLNSLLTASQFSVPSYLNLAISDKNGSGELQQRMAELALQLQLQTQSCHEDIGRIGAELQAILPRCAADVGRVGVGLEGMKIDAGSLLESTSISEEEEVSSSLETLSTLHALQSNLSRTKEILTAAATWDSTLSSVAPLLAQQNLTEAVNALAQLESGERALRGMPHPEERQEAISKIRQQVQVLLQPQLKHALQNMNTRLAPLQQCVSLYMKLGKVDALKNEYVKIRPAALHKAWFSYTPSFDAATTDPNESEHRAQGSEFLTWLPSWYDAVLSLITEERRQSSAVFGHELVPEIVVKVLRECFRPILPSFRSRLESLFSSSVSGPAKGSLESVCAVYESTLQFLSLIYESIAGGWLDMAESGFLEGDGVNLLDDMTTIFQMVASPFAPYQKDLAQLELKHSSIATQLVVSDIQEVVGTVVENTTSQNNQNTLMALQDATDRLKGLSTFVFPLAEDALTRFELLNGGYNVKSSLSMIDELLVGHAKELATAVKSLASAMTADQQQLAENFDDQHVLCALEVLKIAGSFRRDLQSFESKTRERFTILCERMINHTEQEKVIQEALSKTKKSASNNISSSSFVLPDSLSVVEIDSFLTKYVCDNDSENENQNDDTNDDEEDTTATNSPSIKLLLSFTAGLSDKDNTTATLYPELEDMMNLLTSCCHSFVFSVCSAVPYHYLGGVSSMLAWKEDAAADSFASYGTLPQQYITHVGEHMLALVQALEPFASDADALALANEVMNSARDVSLPAWQEFVSAAGIEDDSVAEKLMNGSGLSGLVISHGGPEDEGEELEVDGEEEDEAAKASAAFCNAWLDVVGLAVSGRLLERMMRIPQLSAKGCEHISADLNYLVNVFSALGLPGHPHPLIVHIAELATQDSAELENQISTRDRFKPMEAALQAIEQRLALMRGVAVNY